MTQKQLEVQNNEMNSKQIYEIINHKEEVSIENLVVLAITTTENNFESNHSYIIASQIENEFYDIIHDKNFYTKSNQEITNKYPLSLILEDDEKIYKIVSKEKLNELYEMLNGKRKFHNPKDLVMVSIITTEDNYNFDYSFVIVKANEEIILKTNQTIGNICPLEEIVNNDEKMFNLISQTRLEEIISMYNKTEEISKKNLS